MPRYCVCFAKVTTLFLGLWGMANDWISRNQNFVTTTDSLWQYIPVVITIFIVWPESRNALGSKEPGYSKFVGEISKRGWIPAGWWSSKRSSHGRRSQRAMGNEIWWVFYHPIRRSVSNFASWRRQSCGTIIQIRIPLLEQLGRIWSLSN